MTTIYHCHHGGLIGQCQECADEKMASIVCAKCGGEYLVILPPSDDVFWKVQRETGMTVCGECIEAARTP